MVFGDPAFVHPTNYRGVYRHILAHELEHGQAEVRVIVGVDPVPLLPSEINFQGEIHYVTGFKAVAYDSNRDITQEPTVQLEEYSAQYLAMHMFDAFREKDPVLEAMKKHGRGITDSYITGAEILNNIFRANNVQPEVVARLHYQSDIRGLISILEDSIAGLGKQLIKACTQPNFEKSLEELIKVRERFR